MIKRLVFLTAMSLILVSCGQDPVSTDRTNNPNVPVSLMFEHEGCKVYRFKDSGEYVYYTNCEGSTYRTKEEYCGKGCTRHLPVVIQTKVH